VRGGEGGLRRAAHYPASRVWGGERLALQRLFGGIGVSPWPWLWCGGAAVRAGPRCGREPVRAAA